MARAAKAQLPANAGYGRRDVDSGVMAILVGAREDVNWANSAFRVIMAVRFLIRYLLHAKGTHQPIGLL
jgi:hypothetical protein